MKETAETLQIAGLQLENPIIAAPMAGFTTAAYRNLLKEYGAALAVSEMISAQALVYDNQKTWQMLDIEYESDPIAIQLSGHEPAVMAEAARLIEEKFAVSGRKLCLLDLNMGCPAPKIVRNGDGAALSQNPQLAAQIAEAVAKAVKTPVTAKLRMGWDEENENYLEMGKRLEQAGIAALTLHGRFRRQYYSGVADRTAIARLAESVSIPVIGNGDINSPASAADMLEQGKCAGIMIGRGCIGNPWLIADCAAFFKGEKVMGRPAREEILQTALRHLQMEIDYARRHDENAARAEQGAVHAMRTHLGWYFKGLRGAASMREAVNHMESYAEIEDYLLSKSDEDF